MHRLLAAVVIAASVVLSSQVHAAEFVVRDERPRLIDVDRAKNSSVAKLLLGESDFARPTPVDRMVKDYKSTLGHVRMFALAYALKGKDRDFEKARECAWRVVEAARPKDDYEALHQLEALSYFYDLTYSRITPELRLRVADKIKELIDQYGPKQDKREINYGGSHFHYANLITMYAAIVLHGDVDWASGLLELAYSQFEDGFWPFYRYFAEEDGGFNMWWEYSRYYIQRQLELCAVWKNATGVDLTLENAWLGKTFDFLAAGLRGDDTYWGTGDNHSRPVKETDLVNFYLFGVLYDNPDARALYEEYRDPGHEGLGEIFARILAPSTNGLSNNASSPKLVSSFDRVGAYVFKDGTGKDSVQALFKSTPTYLFNHSHRDANHFSVWHKEDLAIDSGYYDYYFSSHWFNYYTRTIAHNTVTIYDPDERIADWDKIASNDGGQRYSQFHHEQPYNVEDLSNPRFNVAESELVEDNDGYAYARGDATRAYSPHKLEKFVRHFVYLKDVEGWDKPVIVVFDEVVSTKPEFKKTWLLHSINKPDIDGSVFTVKNGSAKLVNYVIAPEDYVIEAIGGSGREFEVEGVNYPPKTGKVREVKRWAGAWRVEVSNKEKRNDVRFLNVLVPMDAGQRKRPDVGRIEDGVRVGDWALVLRDGELSANRMPSPPSQKGRG